ncbi:MAG TPA: hypothetical protein VK907_13170 [Phnomibacter sp.]|nr:hypothetical protein [Phnomibacter sp.]
MKTQFLLTAFVIITAISCSKEVDTIIPDQATGKVSKTISFSLAQDRNYSDPYYNGVRAEVRLAIMMIRTATNQEFLLWDSTITARGLNTYPERQNPVNISKHFHHIDDNSESISASYFVTYRDADDQVSNKGRNEFANPGTSVLTMPIRL